MSVQISWVTCVIGLSMLTALGCGEANNDVSPVAKTEDSTNTKAADTETAERPAKESDEDYEIGALDFGVAAGEAKTAKTEVSPVNSEQTLEAVMQQLRPLQGLLGLWRGTTRREFGDFKAVDSHEWVWDLKTDPQQPALVLESDESPYVRTARLTWQPSEQRFLLTTTDGQDVPRSYTGVFDEPVQEIVGDDNKLHKTFRLLFTETTASVSKHGSDQWQLAWNAQDSNRYLLQIDRRRGQAKFRRHDVVSTQRKGTSFAVSDSDYGEKTCIISQGLGTISVSYKGRTYWVCCSGCKAAFEEDPETWIARAEKAAAKKTK